MKNKAYKCKKGIKKITKAEDGLGSINPDVLGTASMLGAGLIDGATSSSYSSRYTSQLKDENQALGRGIGAGVGQSLNLVAPGLGTIASPLLSSVGGAIQRGFQEDKLAKLKKQGDLQDNIDKHNQTINTDLTSFQAKQYKTGGTTKTKVIEIEGKQTPEIHTDKNFNIKNLGTTPHSKGGNKVVAEEGDVVFPTQNSEKKYNEIMTAIKNKDKYKLKKEQDKLPEDKNPKYALGVNGIETEEERLARESRTSASGNAGELLSDLGNALGTGFSRIGQGLITKKNQPITDLDAEKDNYRRTYGDELYNKKYSGSNWHAPQSLPKYQPTDKGITTNSGYHPLGSGISQPKQVKGAAKTTGRVVGKSSNLVAPKPLIGNKDNPDLPDSQELAAKSNLNSVLDSKYSKIDVPTTQKTEQVLSGGKEETKKGFKTPDLNTLAEVAPIAYNLGQGLFGKAEKVNRRHFTPELEKYVDTSSNMRREVNSAYKTSLSNSRNLSGGLASNMRANSQAASNAKLGQVNQIDSQEYGKQLDVNNRNVGITNNAKLTNLQLDNQYDDLDAQNRAKKSEALSTGLNDLGDLGYRNKKDANDLKAQFDALNLLKKGTNYEVTGDKNGQNLNLGFTNGSGYSSDLYSQNRKNNSNSKLGVFGNIEKESKGSKGIKVERKYKLK